MKLLLKPLKSPQIIHKNPFMRKEDAYNMLHELKQLYYSSSPIEALKRIVIHKNTFFTAEETEGICMALEGIDDIELLQILEYSNWRAIRYNENKIDRGFNGYPIKRGTVIPLDDKSFLIWTNGSVMSDELAATNRNYYKTKRGIPAPLLVRRFLGKASDEIIAKEILMLTKMNWNSGDSLYKTLPGTLDFSKVLSRVSTVDGALYNTPYDFRFFI